MSANFAQVNAALSKSGSDQDDSFVRRYVQLTAVDGSNTSLNKCNFDREELVFTLRDLFVAGKESISGTLRWALMLLANHREVLSRMQKEVDEVIGTDRHPSLDDESKMPYTQAVILETMRRHTVAPLALYHSTLCDTQLGEYFIPKDTMVRVIVVSDEKSPLFLV